MTRSAKNHVTEAQRVSGLEHAHADSMRLERPALASRLEPRAGQFEDPYGDSETPARVGLVGRLFYWFVWLVTLSLFTVALLRLVDHDGEHFFIWLNAFTRYVYLPAYACLAWAVWKRRGILAVANIAIVSLHIVLLAPDFMRDRRFERAASSASADVPAPRNVRIFFANVRALNTEHQSLLEEMKAADPDVIVLVEFSWLWHMAYHRSPFFAAYPYGGGMDNKRLDTVNVFSRIPLKSDKQDWAGRGLQTIEIPVGSQTLHLIGLHAPRPMDFQNDNYEGFWARTVPTILSENGPLVVVGDFNATQYSAIYEQLTADRLRSAHQDRGRGYATTWPNGQLWLPPIRIDQALLSPEIECVGIREGEGRGSDHKPLILDVKIHSTH